MAFTFDLEAAIDAIATLEAAIATPSPGITTSYGHKENPNEITDPALLPAVIHMYRGFIIPNTQPEGRYVKGGYYIAHDIDSLMLILEIVPEQYATDEGTANLYADSVLETFLNHTNKTSLADSANAEEYVFIPGNPSYGVVAWPPINPAIKSYWGFTYTHRFYNFGGGG